VSLRVDREKERQRREERTRVERKETGGQRMDATFASIEGTNDP
jgi:hypothetical protein